MGYMSFIDEIKKECGAPGAEAMDVREDEVYIETSNADFRKVCLTLHKRLNSPVMMYFASDDRKDKGVFTLYCVFLGGLFKKWFIVRSAIGRDDAEGMGSLAKEIYSASLFEREIAEMFGIKFAGHPDKRGLKLHNEVWPEGSYPLCKDFVPPQTYMTDGSEYKFNKVEGEGVFEVPVGPVHAGIIGPGHFRFSAAGEPIINLETRLGFTHRGVEKLLEGKDVSRAVHLSEHIAGDSAFAYSLAFSRAVEKICGIKVPERQEVLRGIYLELERMYNHAADIGGIALDVGFSFAAALASIMKESILALNERTGGSRYLKNINQAGGVKTDLDKDGVSLMTESLGPIMKDLGELKTIMLSNISFMDRVDTTGVLRKKTAIDLGIVGLAARSSGIPLDLRKTFPGIYESAGFNMKTQEEGDVLARLNTRFAEFEESARLIKKFLKMLDVGEPSSGRPVYGYKEGFALGYAEAWRGAVLVWVSLDASGRVDRCKIVDPSFHNWHGLTYAVLGNIIPDFPVCNKSFDLSYPGNDL